MKKIIFAIVSVLSLAANASIELPSGYDYFFEDGEFSSIKTTCEKRVVIEAIRLSKKHSLDKNNNYITGTDLYTFTKIKYRRSELDSEDAYDFETRFPSYNSWRVTFKGLFTRTTTKPGLILKISGFGFQVITTIPTKTHFFSSDLDCQIVDYKKIPDMKRFFEIESGRAPEGYLGFTF